MLKIPMIGLGTWQLRGPECTKVVKLALEIGYRHIDTAEVYDNHTAVQAGIKGFDRNELFITSKVLPEHTDAEKACDRALKELGVDYIDLYLLHSPDRSQPMVQTMKQMEQLKKKGKILHCGVSNFTVHHLEDMKGIGIEANQVEFHPYLNQKELLAFCRKKGIQLISYRPLGKGKLLEDENIRKIGEERGMTPAQVVLCWLVQQKIPTIPKASSEKHLRDNLSALQFTLTSEEMKLTNHLHQNKRFCEGDWTDFNY